MAQPQARRARHLPLALSAITSRTKGHLLREHGFGKDTVSPCWRISSGRGRKQRRLGNLPRSFCFRSGVQVTTSISGPGNHPGIQSATPQNFFRGARSMSSESANILKWLGNYPCFSTMALAMFRPSIAPENPIAAGHSKGDGPNSMVLGLCVIFAVPAAQRCGALLCGSPGPMAGARQARERAHPPMDRRWKRGVHRDL